MEVIDRYNEVPMKRHFDPYSNHGGSILAVAGEDFAMIASDTRLSEGFQIHSREMPKTYQLTDKTVLGSCGFHGDVLTLTKNIKARITMYEHEHSKVISTSSIAQMLSTTLYYKRFFPYYTYNIIAGIDNDGKGAVYSFDPVGSYERETYRAGGSCSAMLQSFLDNQIGQKNLKVKSNEPLTQDRCQELIQDVFISAAERDIETGDGVIVHVITAAGISTKPLFELRQD